MYHHASSSNIILTNKWHHTINTDNDHNTVNDTDIPDDDLADGDEI